MFLKTLLLSTLVTGTQSHKTPPWISLFNNDDAHCRNTDAFKDTYTAFTNDSCKVLPSGGNRGDPDGNRIGGYWGDLNNITAYNTRDCWKDKDAVWHIYKGAGGVSDDSHFCLLLKDVSPNDPEPYFAGVKGFWAGSGLDLSSLDINHIPPVA